MPERAKIGTFPNRILELRLQREMTQEELAVAIGTTHATIQRLETGQLQLKHNKIMSLAAALRCHPGELFAPLTRYSDPEEERAAAFVRGMSADGRAAWFQVGATLSRSRRRKA